MMDERAGGMHLAQRPSPYPGTGSRPGRMLRRANVKMSAITALGVALGPGSFTSLRVDWPLRRACAARHIPIIGIPTLDVAAAAVAFFQSVFPATVPWCRQGVAAWLLAGTGPGKPGWLADGLAEVTTADETGREICQPVIVCGENVS